MRPTTVLFVAAVAASAIALPVAAQTAPAERFAVGVQGGTTGLGVEGQFAASNQLTLRASFDSFQYDTDFSSDDIDYEGELDLNQGGVFVDYHPGGGAFFVSGGAYVGDRRATVRAASGASATINGTVYTGAQIGTLEGEADFGDVAPFVGLGFNNTFTGASRLGFKALVGAAFGEDPSVSLRRVGGIALPAAVQAQLEADLRAEEESLRSDIEDYSIYPVVQVGLAYRF